MTSKNTSDNNQAKALNKIDVSGSHSFLDRYRMIMPYIKLLNSAKKRKKQLEKWEGRRFDLIDTKRLVKSEFNWDAILEIGISGQDALNVKQLYTMERLFKNQKDWRIKLAIWLIGKTPL